MKTSEDYLTGWDLVNRYVRPFDRAGIDSNIPAHLHRVAGANGNRHAIVSDDRTVTYAELDRATDRLAGHIVSQLGPNQDVLPFLEENGIPSIVAMLGIIKAGKICLALNPKDPLPYLQNLINIAGAESILSSSALAPLARDLIPRDGVLLLTENGADGQYAEVDITCFPDQPALLLQTGGTSGGFKLVVRSHRLVLHTTWSNGNGVYLNPEQRLGSFAFLGHSSGATSTLNTLLIGASLAVIKVEKRSIAEIVASLAALEVSILRVPAPFLDQVLDQIDGPHDLPALRLVRCGGQTMRPHTVHGFRKKLGRQCVLVNCLAATESSNIAYFVIPDNLEISDGNVPVGPPVVDKEVLILDREHEPLASDELGEIAVRSQFISEGYWRDSESTRRVFKRDPDGGDRPVYLTGDIGRLREDGVLEHHGRLANFTKIRGYRVQVDAVEAEIVGHRDVQMAVVRVLPDAHGDDRLVAYLTFSKQRPLTASEIRGYLAARLPDYMIPAAFVFLESFPVLPNGKIDRHALLAPDNKRPELDVPYVLARTDIEHLISAIWAEVLGLERVGIHDHFLDLGGHSLLATRIVNRLQQLYDLDVTLTLLFEAPTVAELARVIEMHLARGSSRT